jgi:hypothetical protein
VSASGALAVTVHSGVGCPRVSLSTSGTISDPPLRPPPSPREDPPFSVEVVSPDSARCLDGLPPRSRATPTCMTALGRPALARQLAGGLGFLVPIKRRSCQMRIGNLLGQVRDTTQGGRGRTDCARRGNKGTWGEVSFQVPALISRPRFCEPRGGSWAVVECVRAGSVEYGVRAGSPRASLGHYLR